ncbi:putative Glyoxalase/bleomycin resistance protein/dioxygenase [Tenacibaculum litopenaei]|uniref:VOC family protein n=1 Tax=Tenacibaculum litopenaei TaxID=396016 RepID=UPI0038942E07
MSKYLYILLFLFITINTSFSQGNSELSKIKPYSITFSVASIEKMTDWYQSKLGFKKLKEKKYPEFNTYLIFLELNGYRVELIKDYEAVPKITNPKAPQRHTGVWGQTQFCFITANLEKVKRELINKSVAVDWEYQNKELGVKFFFIKDPEGNMIQFLQEIKATKE